MKKSKGDKTIWCYFGLVILVMLLLLPISLRLFGKHLYEKEAPKKDVVQVLDCNKDNATINSTFLNSIPQNLSLKIKGDYTIKYETDANGNTQIISNNQTADEDGVIKYIRDYSEISYEVTDDVTTFKVNMTSIKQLNEYIILFNNLENQQKYYVSQAFYCTVINY